MSNEEKKFRGCRACATAATNNGGHPCPHTNICAYPAYPMFIDRLVGCTSDKAVPETFTRQSLAEFIAEKAEGVKSLFAYKNQDYGSDQDAFANFRKTAVRIVMPFMEKRGVKLDEREAMFLVAQVLQDKHLVALSQTGISGNEVEERLSDVANYALIMSAILKHG